MKKSVVTVLLLGLLAGMMVAAPAEAKKRKKKKPAAPVKVERQVQGTYAAPATAVGLCSQTDAVGCVTIPTGSTELYITAKVTDDSGAPVLISVKADLDGDNASETLYGNFCGETTEPIQVDPGAELIFWVSPVTAMADRATMGCVPGQGTAGSIDVTLSNML